MSNPEEDQALLEIERKLNELLDQLDTLETVSSLLAKLEALY